MNKLGRIDANPAALAPALTALTQKLEASKAEAQGLQKHAVELLQRPPHDAEFKRIVAQPVGREEALLALLDKVAPETADALHFAWAEQRDLAAVSESFHALCRALRISSGRDDVALPTVAHQQAAARQRMLGDVGTVKRGLLAAGICEATAKFPRAQLDQIEASLSAQLEALKEAPAPAPHKLLRADQVKTAAASGEALGRLLGDDALGRALAEAAGRAQDPASYARDLGAFALLVDQASSAPDYARTRAGWHYPNQRRDYRARAQDSRVLYQSEGRLAKTQSASLAAARTVLEAQDPGAALSKALSTRFLSELGAAPLVSAAWTPSAEGIARALAHEALLPLRALNETVDDMARVHGNYRLFSDAVSSLTQAVVEGKYRDWRNSHPLSRAQLEVLNPEQQAAWLGHNAKAEIEAPHGGLLATREEDDLDLLWLTKIGGPSHGFDYGGHCLLPLLTNARTRALVVEDERWPDHPAARAYLRLVSTPEGKPVLYLEPLQRDFGHREAFKNPELDTYFEFVILAHAARKAEALGVPLSVASYLGGLVKQLGLDAKLEAQPRFVLAPSAGVVEASDTLTQKHDWVQTKSELVTPHQPRLLIQP